MVKKKNRKKELKKQQKLDIKVLKQEEAELFEFFHKKPTIVERRTIQNYDNQKTAIFQEFERTGVEPDYRQINHQLADGTFSFSEDYALFRKAMHTPNARARKKLLKEVLAINPDFFAARFHLLLIEEEPFERSYFEKVYKFYQQALDLWKAEDYADWSCFETRPIHQGLMYCLEYFIDEGFYGLAVEIIETFRSHGLRRFPPNFLPIMFSLYNQLGQYDKVEQAYYAEVQKGNKDDGALLHLLISKVLQGKWDEADKLFVQLEKMNGETSLFFGEVDWLDRVLEIEEKEVYIPFTEESLQTALYPLFDFLNNNMILEKYLTRCSDDWDNDCDFEDDFSEVEYHRNISHLHRTLSHANDWFSNLNKPEFAGIRMDLVRIFTEQKLASEADFKKKTEKEILSIKGIGPGTVKKLKENGVVFKKEN
ncbi:hypothetical protein SUT007_04640 [Streptococcus parasuis]|nr:hypothetical protein SUT007_04640 [Streptococcus parasuis]